MESPDKSRMFFYERFASDFDAEMNMYDLNKRVEVVYDELLTADLTGKTLLDAGCGTGWFSKWACERQAKVTSVDLGEGLLACVAEKCDSNRVVGSILELPMANDSFDFVVSSEVIEHVPEPEQAIAELYRVTKPGGTLVLTTPNKLWFFAVWIANRLHLRPYQGLENWMSWGGMRRCLRDNGFQIRRMCGIHLFPFVHPFLYPILDIGHRFNRVLGPVMVNMAVECKK